MKISKYVSLLTEVIHIIVVIKEKVPKRWGLWYGFYTLNIDTEKSSFWKKTWKEQWNIQKTWKFLGIF